MIGGALIAKGGYGCIFHPAIESNNEKFVSKVQLKSTFASINERNISEILSKVKNNENFFGLITKTSNINIKKISKKDLDECAGIIKDYKSDQFILMEIPFVGKQNYQEYVLNQEDNKNAFLYFIETYKRLLQAIEILGENNIVHFDFKDNNIVFHEMKKIPILIDFGLSIDLSKVKESLLDYFYIYAPDYYYWPLEVHYLNFLLHEKDHANEEDINHMATEFVKNCPVLTKNFSPKFLEKYLNECKKILKKYQQISNEKIVDHILSSSKKWDNYSLSMGFLQNLQAFNPKGFIKNEFISFFAGFLVQNIHPDPEKRLTPKETREKFDKYLYVKELNNTENFLEILDNITEFRREMNNQIKENIKEVKRLGTILDVDDI